MPKKNNQRAGLVARALIDYIEFIMYGVQAAFSKCGHFQAVKVNLNTQPPYYAL